MDDAWPRIIAEGRWQQDENGATTYTPDPRGPDALDPEDHAPPRPAASPGRRVAPPDVWAAVRADYEAGLSGPACARRHGVGLSTLRERAGRDEWRRIDQPWTPPEPLGPDDEGLALEEAVDGDLDRIDYGDLADVARARMTRAVLRGDARSALRWRRVHEVMQLESERVRAWMEEDVRLAAALARRRTLAHPDSSDGSDASDPFFDPSGPSDASDPAPSP